MTDPTQSTPDLEQGFAPRDTLERALRYWWLLALLMVGGAAVGWGIFAVRPPIYEAVSTLSITIDYGRTGPMIQFDEDQALNAAGFVAQSLVGQAATDAKAQGFAVDPGALNGQVFAQRKLNIWELRVRHTDPQAAAWLANRWAELSEQTLRESLQHAAAAETLQRRITSLESCLQQTVSALPYQTCTLNNLPAIQQEAKAAGSQWNAERQASRGLMASLMLSPAIKAEVPLRPVVYGRSSLIFAGALIGALIALWAIQMNLPVQLARWRQRG